MYIIAKNIDPNMKSKMTYHGSILKDFACKNIAFLKKKTESWPFYKKSPPNSPEIAFDWSNSGKNDSLDIFYYLASLNGSKMKNKKMVKFHRWNLCL